MEIISTLTQLPAELFIKITDYLGNRDKLNLIECSKELYRFRNLLRFHDMIDLSCIIKYEYTHHFTNVCVNLGEKTTPEDLTHIPKTVTHLIFGWYFNQPLGTSIPIGVRDLTFGWCFNQPLESSIPRDVRYLTFGYNFNQPLGESLPDTITHLRFGAQFNQPLGTSIPRDVRYLTFGEHFDQPLGTSIPFGVVHIAFGWRFDQELEIPSSVKTLKMLMYYDRQIPDHIEGIEWYDGN